MKNIAKKMVNVMREMKRIAKNGRNDFHKYDFVTESDVMDAIRAEFEKNELVMTTSVVHSHKDGNMTSVVTRHQLIDAESGEMLEFQGFGQGADNSDKGGPKAVTSAVKYVLLKNFLLSAGDDPEASDENGKATGKAKAAPVKAAPAVASGTETKKYGFSNRAKAGTTAATKVEPEVSDEDGF